MPLIFLSENNSLSRKVLKKAFPSKDVSLFEIPLKKMKKRAIAEFRERLISFDALFLSSPSLKFLLPEKNVDTRAFFNSFIAETLFCILKRKNLSGRRLVIVNPELQPSLSALGKFSDIALSGEGATKISALICEKTGASVPIVSGSSRSDIVFCVKGTCFFPCSFLAGFDIAAGENTLSADSLKFYPETKYSSFLTIAGRPLTLAEAALLSEYDKKATFNIAF